MTSNGCRLARYPLALLGRRATHCVHEVVEVLHLSDTIMQAPPVRCKVRRLSYTLIKWLQYFHSLSNDGRGVRHISQMALAYHPLKLVYLHKD